MRFHVGFSFSWKQLKKIIIPVLIGIALYFGFNMNVYASDTLLTYSHAGQQFYKSVCIEGDGFNSCTQYGQQGYQSIPWNDYYFLPSADPVYNAVYSFNQINVDSSGYDVKSNVFYKVVVTFEHGDLLTVDYNSWKNLKCGVYVNGQWDTKATSTCFGSYSNYTYTAFIRSDVPGTGLALFIGNTTDMSKSLLYSNVQDSYEQGARASSISVYSVDDNSGLLENIGNSIDNSTQDILNNQNQNTQDIIDSQKVCKVKEYDSNSFNSFDTFGYINSSGYIADSTKWRTSPYIDITSQSSYFSVSSGSSGVYTCFYDSYKILIPGSCQSVPNTTDITYYNIPENAVFVRLSVRNADSPKYTIKLCQNTGESINDTLTDSNIDNGIGTGFFDDFRMNDHGINTIITAPLRLINGLLDGSHCGLLNFTVMGTEVALPSGCILWNNVPTAVVTIYQTIVFGLVAYRYLIAIKKTISNIQNPTKDEIEVLNL